MQASKGDHDGAVVLDSNKEIRVAVSDSPRASPRASSISQVRFRPTSKPETEGLEEEEGTQSPNKDGSSKMRRVRQETLTEKLYRYRGVVIVISIPIALILFVLLTMPRVSVNEGVTLGGAAEDLFDRQASKGGGGASKLYSVVFDAGSSGSRVHVFCFDRNVDLVKMEDGELELFEQIKPGLSNYSDNPKKGAKSLNGLLQKALDLVPKALHSSTPVRLGATAGLRMLPGNTADEILHEVRQLLHNSGFKFQDNWVSILDGANEGTYQWITVNYLLGNLRKPFEETVGVVDLGGGSVQMSYAVSEEASTKAPKPLEDRTSYIVQLQLLGQEFNLYVYSYLRYGLYAVRSEILKLVSKDATCPCLLQGYEGSYVYGGEQFTAVADASGADVGGCKELVLQALNKHETCTSLHCTFGGVWSGGGGSGQSNLLVASFFFDKAAEVGIIKDSKAATAIVKPSQFEDAAKDVCGTSSEEVESKYPGIQASDRAYICMDLLYEYVLLVDGFGVRPDQEIKLVKRVEYKGAEVEAAWALGMAIQSVSS
ncbi:unnamed protein product [Calypogeia fissa]